MTNKIGEGYSYEVYDLGQGQVLKIYKRNIFKIARFIIFKEPLKLLNRVKQVIRSKKRLSVFYVKLLNRVDTKIFANLEFINKLDYRQDKCTAVFKMWNDLDQDAKKDIIESYCKLCLTLWNYSCHDSVFNFLLNNGIDKNNKLVFIDFNEFTENKEFVTFQINSKYWKNQSSYKNLSESEKQIFDISANKYFTLENLDKHWWV